MICQPCQGTGRRWLQADKATAALLMASPSRPIVSYMASSGLMLTEAELYTVPAQTTVVQFEVHCDECGGKGIVSCCGDAREQPAK